MAELLMTRVRRYVETCQRYGWRPVFTTEQWKTIITTRFHPGYHRLPDGTETWNGVPFTIDDTPRPPMPSEASLQRGLLLKRLELYGGCGP